MFQDVELPTSEISCVIGYEGDCFYRLEEESTDLVAFTLEDPLPYTFVFVEEKCTAPPIAQVYRDALKRSGELMHTPPYDSNDVYFGNDAFLQWARMLENGFYRMTKEEYERANAIANWRYYCIYVCMLATNIFSKRHTTDRALQLNPSLAPLAPLLDREYTVLAGLEEELKAAGGYFNVTYEILQDEEKCRGIARILRKFPPVFDRICGIIQQWL